MRRFFSSTPAFVFAGLLGLAFGACKGGGSNNPGTVSSVSGSSACPRQVPRNGSSCPRGQVDFCVYKASGGDFACTCGGTWTCARK